MEQIDSKRKRQQQYEQEMVKKEKQRPFYGTPKSGENFFDGNEPFLKWEKSY